MERVQDAEQTVEVFENEIQMYLSMFCESNAIESEYDILPRQQKYEKPDCLLYSLSIASRMELAQRSTI